jgi:phytoene/squalene synthetase
MAEFQCPEDDLLRPSTSDALRKVIDRECDRTRELLTAGPPLAASLPWRARLAVAGFVAGGLAAVESIERADYDVLAVHCRPSKRGVAEHMTQGFITATFQKSAA